MQAPTQQSDGARAANARISAYRVRDDGTVKQTYLTPVLGGATQAGQWWRTPRGAQVMIDYPHSEYFSVEERALKMALARATSLRVDAEDRLRSLLHREHAAHEAMAAWNRKRTADNLRAAMPDAIDERDAKNA